MGRGYSVARTHIGLALLFTFVPAIAPTSTAVSAPRSESAFASTDVWRDDSGLLVFQSRRSGNYEIYLAEPEGRLRQLTRNGVEDRLPEWSPDGRRILFIRSTPQGVGSYYVMTSAGGGAWRLGKTRAITAYEWSPEGQRIAYAERGISRLGLVNADGSGRRWIYDDDPVGFDWSADGTAIAFGCVGDVCVVSADGSGIRRLVRNARDPDWSPSGRRIAFRRGGGAVFTVRPDGAELRRVLPARATGNFFWEWSPDGRRLAIHEGGRLGIVNADGTRFRWVSHEGEFPYTWSPDGRRIAFDCGGDAYDICVASVATGGVRNLTRTGDRYEFKGAWSPGGKALAFKAYQRDVDDDEGIFVVSADGGVPRNITRLYGDTSWSPDGGWISFWEATGTPDLYIVKPTGANLTRIARLALREAWQPR